VILRKNGFTVSAQPHLLFRRIQFADPVLPDPVRQFHKKPAKPWFSKEKNKTQLLFSALRENIY